jgi:dTDP-4-dehydrorhamnose reductase
VRERRRGDGLTRTRRVLVTGAGGLLGGRLALLLAPAFDVVAARRRTSPPAGLAAVSLDLDSPLSIERALDEARPDAVVHAAAVTDPDHAERFPDEAARVNVQAVEVLARLCGARGIHLVLISTDLVFAGDRAPYREDDAPAPLLAYGRTKLLGEDAALQLAPGAAVARVALVHGRGYGPRASATESIAWSLRAGRGLRLYTDQFRTVVDPVSAADALERILRLGAAGRFHVGGPERVSRYDLGRRVAARLLLPASLIAPATLATHATGAPRPPDVSLDSSRALRELDWRPRPVDDGIDEGRAAPD